MANKNKILFLILFFITSLALISFIFNNKKISMLKKDINILENNFNELSENYDGLLKKHNNLINNVGIPFVKTSKEKLF